MDKRVGKKLKEERTKSTLQSNCQLPPFKEITLETNLASREGGENDEGGKERGRERRKMR